jgi:Protein of unknown function (DUF1565)
MKRFLLLALLLAPGLAQGQLQWRISIKVFTNTNGASPQIPNWSLGGATLLQELTNGVTYANTMLSNTWRGYTWQLTEIVTVSGTTAPLPAATNSWFNLPVGAGTQDDLDAKAKANPNSFQYRNNAINFYYVNGTTGPNGGYCAFPNENQHVILVAPNSFADVLIHEAGHFFSLQHTHNTQSYLNNGGTACTNANACTCAFALGGDDGIADTPLDNTCWNQDTIARSNFNGRAYATLTAGERFFVDNSWLNIMSYHSPGVRFTDDQMDFVTELSNTTRFNVATGRTRFVDWTNPGAQDGSRANPFRGVGQGIVAADPGDIVLIRPGNYNETATYAKPITLRATRGAVTVGRP